MFAHYIEPTADGRVTWVGDEAGCGQPAIVRSMDTSSVPAPGAPKLQLAELGTIVDRPDAPMCQGLINSEKFVGQLQDYRWTGHNFDIWSNGLLIRGDYGRDWGLKVQQNLVHGSDSTESAARELEIWFD